MNRLALALLLTTLLSPLAHAATQPATLTLDAAHPGPTIPPDFAGASYEMQLVSPAPDGSHYFSPDNRPLLSLFHTLGIHSLRVGGNTVDKPGLPAPTPADLQSLFAFAHAAGVKVIFTLRLREGTPAAAAHTAHLLADNYRDQLDCIAAGNEPNVYAKTYEGYRDLMKEYYPTLSAAAPNIPFCGPGATPAKAAWARSYAEDFGPTRQIKFVTQHSYPGGSARKVTDPAAARAQMLSRQWTDIYQKMYDAFVPAAKKAGLRYRLEETNSFFNGGAKDVSDTHAAAIWALDYLYWWAAHDAAGLNFHTGDNVAAGDELTPCRYALFRTSPQGGYTIHPIAYALKAFDLASHGTLIPTTITSPAYVTAYAVQSPDHHTYLTLINKELSGPPAHITLPTLPGSTAPRQIRLTATDPASTNSTTLGDAPVSPDGSWAGHWTPLPSATLDLPPASAAIVDFTIQ